MNESPVPDADVPLWELVRTAHLAERRFADVFAEAGIGPAQYGVLASLVDGDGLSQADLARAVHVRPQSMGRLITGMVEQGLVTRVGPGGRGRRTGLRPTDAGRRALDRARPAARAAGGAAALGLHPDDARRFVAHLRTIRASLERAEVEASG